MAEHEQHSETDDELLSAYVDGELSDTERAAVEQRLINDPAARQLVEQLRALSGELRSLPRETLDASLRDAVLQQTGQSKPTLPLEDRSSSSSRHWVWASLAVAAALLLMFYQKQPQQPEVSVAQVEPLPPEGERSAPRFEALPTENEGGAGGVELDTFEAQVVDEPASVADAQASSSGDEESPIFDHSQSLAGGRADAQSNVGLVRLTLTDFRSGGRQFAELLERSGVEIAEELRADHVPREDVASTVENQPTSRTLSGEPAAAASNTDIGEPTSDSDQTEMVFVEAPPAQIEQILLSCNSANEVEEVTFGEDTASKTVLQQWQGLQRASPQKGPSKKSAITLEQMGIVAALNSLPTGEAESLQERSLGQRATTGGESPEETADSAQLQLGWATRLKTETRSNPYQAVQSQVLQQRHRYLNYRFGEQQTAVNVGSQEASQQLRVLFLLCPSAPEEEK